MSETSNAISLSLRPVSRGKLAESVASQLLAELRGKRLRIGARIPSERELMRAFGVGRSTIREAVNGLAMLGVLEIRHGQGAFVADPLAGVSPPNAIAGALAQGITRDLFEARHLVEAYVARLAAERRTEADLLEIGQALADHRAAIQAGTPAVEASVRFHVKIGEAAHSEVLASFVNSFVEIMTERGPILEEQNGYREWEIEQHSLVFEPIRDGDPDLAQERMRTHLEMVIGHHEHLGLRSVSR